LLELPNLFALLDLVQRAGDAGATVGLTSVLYVLLQHLGKPQLLERVGQVRDAAAATLGNDWNSARFGAAWTRIEQQLAGGRVREALEGAEQLLHHARLAGDQAYFDSDHHLALACLLLGRVSHEAGNAERSLPLLHEARLRFEAVAKKRSADNAARMASVCLADQGDCLRDLGRLDEAAAAYEENIQRAQQLNDARQVAVGKLQLGTTRLQQHRYSEALAAYDEARKQFTTLNEPGTVAVVWHQTGVAYEKAGQAQAAEDAYRKSLAIKVRLKDVTGQGNTLTQLGNLYNLVLDRPKQAAAFFRQATDKYVQTHDAAKEGTSRYNLAIALHKRRRFDEARQEILRAIECGAQFGHASLPWKSWNVLADIETDLRKPAAAAAARAKAIAGYLAYRRDGGENQELPGRLVFQVGVGWALHAKSCFFWMTPAARSFRN
jgi:tetratricopeptide (TPR) repeat protein